MNRDKSIFIPGAVPSSKNSKEIGFYYLPRGVTSKWFINKGGEFKAIRPTLRSSDQTDEYVKQVAPFIIENKQRFKKLIEKLPKPYIVELFFVRKTKADFDWQNPAQCISDVISGSFWKNHPKIPHVATQWIESDNIHNVLFIPPLRPPFYSVCAENPGCWITVLDTSAIMKVTQELSLFPNETEVL